METGTQIQETFRNGTKSQSSQQRCLRMQLVWDRLYTVSKCIDNAVPKAKVCNYPNHKPRITRQITAKLKPRTDAFNSGDPDAFEEARYEESNNHSSDPRETHLSHLSETMDHFQFAYRPTGLQMKPSSGRLVLCSTNWPCENALHRLKLILRLHHSLTPCR
jgi:hypothetical protein